MRKKKVLFVCKSAKARSPTAEMMFGDMKGIEAKSAGTASDAVTIVTENMTRWADVIFVMEENHKQELIKIDQSSCSKIQVLGIPDLFYRSQPELKQLILEKMQPYIKQFNLR